MCGVVDECPVGKVVSKMRIFSFAQRVAGRVVIRSDRVDVNCCKVCSPDFKKVKSTAVAEEVAPGQKAFGHVVASPPAASGLAQSQQTSGVAVVGEPPGEALHKVISFARARPPDERAFFDAVSALHKLLPVGFWEQLHTLLTSASEECKRVEALLRRNWPQCNGSAPGLLKTLSHVGAIRVWTPSPQFPITDYAAYDSTGVAYRDLGNAVYHRGMAMVYGTMLQCVTGQESVGDLVECVMGFGYYMRWSMMRRRLGTDPGPMIDFDYGLACVDQLETVMLFIFFHWFNKPYLAELERSLAAKRMQPANWRGRGAQRTRVWTPSYSPPPPAKQPRPPNYPPPPYKSP